MPNRLVAAKLIGYRSKRFLIVGKDQHVRNTSSLGDRSSSALRNLVVVLPSWLRAAMTESRRCPVVEFGVFFCGDATINGRVNFLLRFCSAITCVEADIHGALWDDGRHKLLD